MTAPNTDGLPDEMPNEIMAWMGFQNNGSWDHTAPDYLNAVAYVRKDRAQVSGHDLARADEDLRTDFEWWMTTHLGKETMSPYDMGVMAFRAGYRQALRLIDARTKGEECS